MNTIETFKHREYVHVHLGFTAEINSAKIERESPILRNFSNKINSFDTWDPLVTLSLYLMLSISMKPNSVVTHLHSRLWLCSEFIYGIISCQLFCLACNHCRCCSSVSCGFPISYCLKSCLLRRLFSVNFQHKEQELILFYPTWSSMMQCCQVIFPRSHSNGLLIEYPREQF